jgi:hypothetical protein
MKGLVEVSAARAALARAESARAAELARSAVGTLEAATTQRASLLPTVTLLARALNADGRHQDALAAAERAAALATASQVGQRHSAPLGRALVEVAAARLGLGEHAAARRAATDALAHLMATVGANANVTQRAERLMRELPPDGRDRPYSP